MKTMLEAYERGSMSFDQLLSEAGSREWPPGYTPASDWAENYRRAEDVPSPDDAYYWIDSATHRRILTWDQRDQLNKAVSTTPMAE